MVLKSNTLDSRNYLKKWSMQAAFSNFLDALFLLVAPLTYVLFIRVDLSTLLT